MKREAAAPGPAKTLFWRQSRFILPFFTLLGGFVLALRILERGEIWLDRTWWLVAIAAFGGFIGAAGTRMILAARDWRAARLYPRLVSAAIFTLFFMGGMMAAYVAQYLAIGGQFEPNPERPVRGVISAAIQVAALFLISSPAYLLPWPLPALAALAGLVLAPEVPAEPAKPVEPAGDGV